jgi:hypothetical protein
LGRIEATRLIEKAFSAELEATTNNFLAGIRLGRAYITAERDGYISGYNAIPIVCPKCLGATPTSYELHRAIDV